MATNLLSPLPAPPLRDLIGQAPLVPVALAVTTGIVLDRCLSIPLPTSLAFVIALLFAWGFSKRTAAHRQSVVWLWLALAAAGAAYHQWRRDSIAANDIRLFASAEGRPVRLRGVIDSEPIQAPSISGDPLRTRATKPATRMAVRVCQLEHRGDWHAVGGAVQAAVAGKRNKVHVGDEVELTGMLYLPPPPGNPGEFDYAEFLRDQGIGATLSVPDAPDAVEVIREGWPHSLFGWLAILRSKAAKLLEKAVPAEQHGLAKALLLGDESELHRTDLDKYQHTGVIHVMVISGQHLIVLANFMWLIVRTLRFDRRKSAITISILLLAYALMTGARPPIMRAAWMSITLTFAIFLQRVVVPTNSLALSWIGVLAVNPTSAFDTGCQLSFLAVAIIIAGNLRISMFTQNLASWMSTRQAHDPALQQLINETRSWTELTIRRWIYWLSVMYLENAIIWLILTPLIAARFHMVCPVAILIGPWVILASSYALLFALPIFVLGFVFGSFAPFLGVGLTFWLTACEWLVDFGRAIPGGYFYIADLPLWWIAILYSSLPGMLLLERLWGHRSLCIVAGAGWLGLGVLLALLPPRSGEFRCTFLAVGHGGCTVIETPCNRVILYDAGAITGPDVARRHIAPFLWSRGYRRIDEIIISHGDLDHFNGVPALLERFTVRRVTLTPSFEDHGTPGVSATLRALKRPGLERRLVHAPTTWEVDGVYFEALHPPARGPAGIENVRSLVLLVRYDDFTMLLTGDLEEPGLKRVLALPPMSVDVLMAPHHGSRTANTKELAAWARPKFVVSCQGRPKSTAREPNPYEAMGARWLSTWSQGAVTVRRDGGMWIVKTFTTGNRWTISSHEPLSRPLHLPKE